MSFFRKGGILLALLAAVFFWVLGYGQVGYLPKNDSITYHQIGAVDDKQGEHMRQKEEKNATPTDFVLWNQQNQQAITGKETGRRGQVAVVSIRGDSRLLFPQSARLAREDKKGCLLDKATAKKLFGHPQAEGATILYEGRELVVRGVLQYPKATLVLLGDGEQAYSQLSVPAKQGEGDSFAFRHGLSWQLKSGTAEQTQLGRLIVRLPILVLLVVAALFLLSHKRKYKQRALPSTLLFLGLWSIITLFLFLFLYTIPISFLPAKWADYTAWRQISDRANEFISAYLSQPRLRPELGGYCAMAPTLWALLAIPLLFFALGLYKGRENKA